MTARLNECSTSSSSERVSRLGVASISYPFTVFVLALAAGLRIDRHALFQAGQLVSAAAPPNRASATVWTKAVLRDVSGVGQPRETDSSLSHCIVFRHMMPLSWFVLGSFCVSVTVL